MDGRMAALLSWLAGIDQSRAVLYLLFDCDWGVWL